jgi:hypothetical protein
MTGNDTATLPIVIPAEAGIHCRRRRGSVGTLREWIPACAGMTEYGW